MQHTKTSSCRSIHTPARSSEIGYAVLATIDLGEASSNFTARTVDGECSELGFFRVVGHGIPVEVIDAAYSASKLFFDQSDATKQRCRTEDGGFLGYRGVDTLRASTSDSHGPRDPKETFTIGVDPAALGLAPGESEFFPANVWPLELPGFRESLEAYYAAARDLALRLARIFAMALEIPWEFFAARMNAQTSWLTSINYPPIVQPPVIGSLRFGAHRDRGCFTILSTTGPGLEVRGSGGEWESILPEPDSLLVNVGSMLAGWTGRRWSAPMHRVVAEASSARRQTLVFFFNPNHDAPLDALPRRGASGHAAAGPALTAGDYLRSMLSLYQ
ncbi:isopenicillin N synthase family dioxygenase [Nocardia brasiliensis]|uniref:isopenicillin N synthase family dioxygenase n=1 Tax=Nocardia brasiliensis TaxID=37326 RepID=UPI003D916A5B